MRQCHTNADSKMILRHGQWTRSFTCARRFGPSFEIWKKIYTYSHNYVRDAMLNGLEAESRMPNLAETWSFFIVTWIPFESLFRMSPQYVVTVSLFIQSNSLRSFCTFCGMRHPR